MIMLILVSEGVFFLPFVIPRIFRPTLLHAFDYTNTELGSAFSAYGIIGVLSYFFGGPLADRLPARSLIASALFLTGLGGLYLSTAPTYQGLLLLYAFWGFSTIFLLWAAMLKATRLWGTEQTQGFAFGALEGGRGLAAAFIALLGLSFFFPVAEGKGVAFGQVVVLVSVLVMLLGVLAWFIFPSKEEASTLSRSLNWAEVLHVIRLPAIRWQALIIFCAYVGYKATDDLSLMASEVMGFSEMNAALFGGAALWLRPIFPIVAGWFADRYQRTFKVIIVLFALMLVSTLGIAWFTGYSVRSTFLLYLPIGVALIAIYGLRAVYFAGMSEANIPLQVTGTAIGVISVIGYLPDVFFSPLMGWILDSFPPSQAHAVVFLLVGFSAIIGAYSAWRLTRLL